MRAFLFLCLIAFAATADAQVSPKSFTKANAIVLQTPDSASTALRKLATVFVRQGYTIDKLDGQFLTLLTEPKIIPAQYSPRLIVRTIATPGANSVLQISGEYTMTASGIPYSGIAEYTGSSSGTNKMAFAELQKAALAYPAGQVRYGKR